MSYFNPDDKADDKPRKKGPKLKKCKQCRETVVPDGYGEYVHSDTGFYFGRNPKGELDHAATVI